MRSKYIIPACLVLQLVFAALVVEAVDQPVPTVHTGSSAASWAAGLLFGSTLIQNTTNPPLSGQCLEYNGTGFTGAACSSTSSYPAGNTPQLAGFSGVNAAEAESIVGDCLFTRSGANQYTTTCAKTNSVPFGALATLNVGNGLVSGGGSLALVTPVLTSNGGTGVTSPTAHSVPITEGSSAFTLLPMAVDTVLQGTGAAGDPQAAALTSCSTGAVTYNTGTHAFGCNVLGALATLGVGTGLTSSGGNLTITAPVTTPLGGTGVVSPTAHDIMIAEGASAFTLLNLAADTLLQGTAGDPQAAALLSCSSASSALTYNTTTHAFGCNTISGSGTVNTGVQGQLAYYPGVATTVVSPTGGRRVVCAFAGATADIQFNNAIAALPNGGIVDAWCYGFSTQTIAAEVALNNAIPFTILLDRATTYNTTINNAAKAAFHIQGQGSIEGEGESGAAGGFGITLANGASVLAEVYLDNTVGANAGLKNIALNGNSAATVAKGLLYGNGVANIARVTGVQVTGGGSPLIGNLVDITGPMILDNDYFDCGSIASACTPLKLSNDNGGVGTNQVTILNGVYAHEGSGGANAEIDIADAGGNNTGIIIDGPTLESAHTTAIGINTTRCAACVFRAVGCSAAGANGNTCIKISGVSNDITVQAENMYNAWTNTLTNTAQSATDTITQATTPQVAYYNWQGFTNTGEWQMTASHLNHLAFDDNGLVMTAGSNTTGAIVGPRLGMNVRYSVAGTAIPACAAAFANQYAFVSDATACTSGTTYVGSGATCCLLQCNNAGSLWKETGVNCF